MKTINARAETLTERQAYRHLAKRNRCLILGSDLYEWQRVGSQKQPIYIQVKRRPRFAFAGLYDTWYDSVNGDMADSCTIITTAPNELMEQMYNRMPFILPRHGESTWLTEENTVIVLSLLQPYDSDDMTVYPVSTMVYSVRNDSAVELFMLKAKGVYMKSLRTFISLIISLVLLGPFGIILFIYLHQPSLSMNINNELNWVSLMGAVVGGIGAVGGIGVGVMSLFALTQIDKQVKSAFDEQYANHRKELDERSASWATGIKLWAESAMTKDVNESADILHQALEAWPSIPGARTHMLDRFYEETERGFLLDIVPDRRKHLERMQSIQATRSTVFQDIPSVYLGQCVEWWTSAKEHDYDRNSYTIDYIGMKLYAMTGQYDSALKMLRKHLSNVDAELTAYDLSVFAEGATTISHFVAFKNMVIDRDDCSRYFLTVSDVFSKLEGVQYGQQYQFWAFNEKAMVFQGKNLLEIQRTGEQFVIRDLLNNSSDSSVVSDKDDLINKYKNITFVGPAPAQHNLMGMINLYYDA